MNVCGSASRGPVLQWTGLQFSSGSVFLRARGVFLVVASLAFSGVVFAASRVQPVPVPQELRSTAFTVTVNNQPVDVAHAAASYDFVNFDVTGPVTVAITASEPGFWDKGVDIEPWRLGIGLVREGRQTIRFKICWSAEALYLAARRFSESRARCCLSLRVSHRLRLLKPPFGSRYSRRACITRASIRKAGDLLSCAGIVFLRQLESLEGERREGSWPRNDRLRRSQDPNSETRLDAEA